MKKLMVTLTAIAIGMLLQAQGIYELWGMTAYGGAEDAGMIFRTDGRGNNFQLMHSFSATNSARTPNGRLTFLNNKLYGSSIAGGLFDKGVLFEIDPVTGVYIERLSRNDDSNGRTALGELVAYGNKLYGCGAPTSTGMMTGVIFEWDPINNVYTKKIDFTGNSGAAPGFWAQSFILVGNKFYGNTIGGGTNLQGTLFEWDPTTNIYTSKIDLGIPYPDPGTVGIGYGLAVKDGKIYGTTIGVGDNGYGEIFEWDTATNVYTKKINFNINSFGTGTPGVEGASPIGGLTRVADKFFGPALDGGSWGVGVLYDWDPLNNVPTPYDNINGRYLVSHDFEPDFIPDNTGRNPDCKLTAFNGKVYGIAAYGGLNGKGVLFEFDPATNVFTKKHDFSGSNAMSMGVGNAENGVVPVPVSIATGSPGSCATIAAITIDNTNNNEWVPIVDNLGRAIAEIKANGNNLGTVSTEIYVHNATTREDAAKQLYLDRNLTITPQVQPATPVDIRLYIRDAELDALKTAVNSSGHPSGVNDISDVAIFKNPDGCNASLNAGAVASLTTTESWTGGYVLSANINSFSSFYFANKANTTLPLNFVSFTGKLIDNDAVLEWKTENEINTSRFEVERSIDGRNYTVAGNVNAMNSPGMHHYSFKDANVSSLAAPVIYYRLRQIDIDGRFVYSPVVTISVANNPVVFFYPNPVTNKANLTVTVKSSELLQLRVIDNMGRVLKQQQWNIPAGSTSLSVDMKGLMAGLYYLELKGNTISKRLNFLKQ